jgi:hypothetical protein
MEEEASSSRPASDQDRRVRFEDVSDEPEDSSTTGHNNDDPPDEGSGSDSGDEKRGAHTQSSAMCPTSPPKQATVQETADCPPNVSFELQANSTVRIGGETLSEGNKREDQDHTLARPEQVQLDRPSSFSRITISKQPISTITYGPTSYSTIPISKQPISTITSIQSMDQYDGWADFGRRHRERRGREMQPMYYLS